MSQLISLSLFVCPSTFPLPASLHPSCVLPCPPFPQARPPLWYSQSHLQSDIFNGLITLSSHSLIEDLTSTPHPLRSQRALLTSTHLQTSNALFSNLFQASFSSLPIFSHNFSSKPLPSTPNPYPNLLFSKVTSAVTLVFSGLANWTSIDWASLHDLSWMLGLIEDLTLARLGG